MLKRKLRNVGDSYVISIPKTICEHYKLGSRTARYQRIVIKKSISIDDDQHTSELIKTKNCLRRKPHHQQKTHKIALKTFIYAFHIYITSANKTKKIEFKIKKGE